MRALTLWRPWPWAIFHAPHNPKRIENRPWKPWASIVGKQIAIHAGRAFDSDAADQLCSMFAMHPDGDPPLHWNEEGLIGVANVVGCCASEDEAMDFMPDQVIWWAGPYAWKLSAVRAFVEPIPCKGKQGLWEVPADVEAKMRFEARR